MMLTCGILREAPHLAFGAVRLRSRRPDLPESDVDLLIEFEAGRAPGFLALAGMEAELSGMLGGRKVDLRTPKDLSRYFRDDVVREAEVQFAR
jgi:predicted nucleotidyltransferase